MQVVRQTAKTLADMGACVSSCWLWPSITQRCYQTAEILAALLDVSRSRIVPQSSFVVPRCACPGYDPPLHLHLPCPAKCASQQLDHGSHLTGHPMMRTSKQVALTSHAVEVRSCRLHTGTAGLHNMTRTDVEWAQVAG